MTVTVEPGMLLQDLQAYVEARGLFYPPDPGEKASSIGGNISTNAGGMRAVKYGYDCSLINARFIKPLDAKMLDRLTKKHRLIVTIEENVKSGGFGEHVSEYLMRIGADVRVQILALPDVYVEHGNVDVLRKETGLDVESMTAQICKMYETM